MLLTVNNLSFDWHDEPLLQDISCQINNGDVIFLKGENGCGKTTLLKIMAGMIPHFSRGKYLHGDVLINGTSIIENPPKHFFPRIAYMPSQNIDFFLLNATIDEDVALTQAMLQLDAETIETRRAELLRFFPAINMLWKKPYDQMSIYEKNLALLAIYFLQGADLYLFDEILKTIPREQIPNWLNFITSTAQQNCGFLIISHDNSDLKFPIWYIKNGRLIQ